MAAKNKRRLCAGLSCLLLVLAGCGQTGPLMLPGSVPASEPSATEPSDEEDEQREDLRQ